MIAIQTTEAQTATVLALEHSFPGLLNPFLEIAEAGRKDDSLTDDEAGVGVIAVALDLALHFMSEKDMDPFIDALDDNLAALMDGFKEMATAAVIAYAMAKGPEAVAEMALKFRAEMEGPIA